MPSLRSFVAISLRSFVAISPRSVVAMIAPPSVLVVSMFACRGPAAPTPRVRDRTPVASEATCVPYPPPPPKVEEIGARPSDRHVWMDGEWHWETRRWVWKPGGWVTPPEDAFWAPWKTDRLQNGALVFYPGRWHRDDFAPYDAAALASCPAPTAAPAPVIAADGALEAEAHVGPILVYPADAPSSAPAKVVPDATIPSDGIEEVRPLIGPPD